jgi:hypothetical protein
VYGRDCKLQLLSPMRGEYIKEPSLHRNHSEVELEGNANAVTKTIKMRLSSEQSGDDIGCGVECVGGGGGESVDV